MIIKGAPYSTAWPSLARMRLTVPARGAGMWFMVFIASMIKTVWPSVTVAPTETKAAAPGSADRYTVPTMGEVTAPGCWAGSSIGAAGVAVGAERVWCATGAACIIMGAACCITVTCFTTFTSKLSYSPYSRITDSSVSSFLFSSSAKAEIKATSASGDCLLMRSSFGVVDGRPFRPNALMNASYTAQMPKGKASDAVWPVGGGKSSFEMKFTI